MQTDIIIQNVAALRIDPAVLARPNRRMVLIASPANRERLRLRGRDDVFAKIVSLATFDVASLAEAVASIRDELSEPEKHQVRLLCHDEYSLGVVAQVRASLGIDGDRPENIRPFTHKVAMKQALRDAGIRLPRYIAWDPATYRASPQAYVRSVIETVGLPAFVKPTDESGSVGTRRIDAAADLAAWAAELPDGETAGGWEVDEFIDGTLYHVDTVVAHGRIVHVGVNENLYPCYDYATGKLSCSFTLPETDPAHAPLLTFNRLVLAALTAKPASGVFHHEIFMLATGELVFLEIAARAPAALIPFTSQIRYGLNIEEALFRLQRGEEVTPPAQRGPYAAYVYFPKPAGEVIERDRPEIASDHRWTWNVEVGDVLTAATDIRDFSASVLLWNHDIEALRRDLYHLDKHTPVTTAQR